MTYQYLDQFEKYVIPEPNTGCWLWLGYLSENGYGRFSPKYNMAPLYAHRVSYEINKGPIPENSVIDHLCRVRCCVNPDHLEAVTQLENIKRGEGNQHRNKSHCKLGHSFSIENTRYTKDNPPRRMCRECESIRGRLRYQKLRKGATP